MIKLLFVGLQLPCGARDAMWPAVAHVMYTQSGVPPPLEPLTAHNTHVTTMRIEHYHHFTDFNRESWLILSISNHLSHLAPSTKKHYNQTFCTIITYNKQVDKMSSDNTLEALKQHYKHDSTMNPQT